MKFVTNIKLIHDLQKQFSFSIEWNYLFFPQKIKTQRFERKMKPWFFIESMGSYYTKNIVLFQFKEILNETI